MKDIKNEVRKARDLISKLSENWDGTNTNLEKKVASDLGFGSRTTMMRAFKVVDSDNEDVINAFNNEEITITEAVKVIENEESEQDSIRLAYEKLERDEDEASEKINSLYERIQELKYENKVLRMNPTIEDFNAEKQKRIRAEKALNETREFLMNHPSEINPESLRAEMNLELINTLVPDKNECSITMWNSYDKYTCRKRISEIVCKLSALDKELKGA